MTAKSLLAVACSITALERIRRDNDGHYRTGVVGQFITQPHNVRAMDVLMVPMQLSPPHVWMPSHRTWGDPDTIISCSILAPCSGQGKPIIMSCPVVVLDVNYTVRKDSVVLTSSFPGQRMPMISSYLSVIRTLH